MDVSLEFFAYLQEREVGIYAQAGHYVVMFSLGWRWRWRWSRDRCSLHLGPLYAELFT